MVVEVPQLSPGRPTSWLYGWPVSEELSRVIFSDIRLPNMHCYPPHIDVFAGWVWGLNDPDWRVECLVCRRWTGKARARGVLARFLRSHRRCGITRAS